MNRMPAWNKSLNISYLLASNKKASEGEGTSSEGKEPSVTRTATLPAGMLLTAACMAFGQAASSPPTFEVASVKPAVRVPSNQWRRISSADPSRVAYNNATLLLLLVRAYQVKDYQVSGPPWLTQERYDVAAKIPANATQNDVPQMLQALLADRFHLALHHEQRERQTYVLTAARSGFKLQPAADAKGGLSFGVRNGMQNLKGPMTLASLASLLSSLTGTPVLDSTGIGGTFDIQLEWSPDDRLQGVPPMQFTPRDPGAPTPPDAVTPAGPSLFTAIQSLGLKLEPRKAPIDMLVIDRADKTPTEN